VLQHRRPRASFAAVNAFKEQQIIIGESMAHRSDRCWPQEKKQVGRRTPSFDLRRLRRADRRKQSEAGFGAGSREPTDQEGISSLVLVREVKRQPAELLEAAIQRR
jgi:hypothetical protein